MSVFIANKSIVTSSNPSDSYVLSKAGSLAFRLGIFYFVSDRFYMQVRVNA